MIDIACARCGRLYHTQESHLGKRIKCSNPRCGKEILLMQVALPAARSQRLEPSNFEPGRRTRGTFSERKPIGTKRTPIAILGAAIIFLVMLCAFLLVNRPGDDRPATQPSSTSKLQEERLKASQATSQTEAAILDDPKAQSIPAPTPVTVSVDELEEPTVTNSHAPSKSRTSSAHLGSPPAARVVSLPTGTRLTGDVGITGHGALTLRNGNLLDAVAQLKRDDGTTARWVYIQAHQDLTLSQLPPGAYRLLFALGLDWDAGNSRFRMAASYQEIDQAITFQEANSDTGVEYQEHTVTLHPVAGGNVHSHRISEDEFRNR